MRKMFRALFGLLSVAIIVVGFCSPVAAATGDVVAPRASDVVSVNLGLWSVIQGLIVPLVVGILVKATANSTFKVLVQIIVNAIGALIGSVVILDGVATISKATILMWAVATIATISTHYGIWKPTGVTGSTPSTNALAPTRGLG